jgi:hypothetical protein
VKVVRVKNRVYHNGRLVSHSEYAVIDPDGTRGVIAHLVFNRGAWIAVQRTTERSFGKAVSPINMKLLRDVKQWVFEKWGQPDEGQITIKTSNNSEAPTP